MKKFLPVVLCVLLFAACKKESATLQVTPISDYAPLIVGKYVTYQLDSLIYINFGTTEAHHIYEAKYEVTDSTTDGLGRKGFRITRYIRTLPSGSFTPDNTFLAVNTGTTFEFTENNLRFLKLVEPFEEGQTWKGNSAIDVSSLGSDLQYLADWDYTYANVGKPQQVGTYNLENTITVNQENDSFNLPVILPGAGPDPTNIATRDYSQEIYSKDIGLVYKNFLHYEYQLAYNGYIGYGITLTMVDHN
jgi:hypothetical protein